MGERFRLFKRIIRSSMVYEFDGTVLQLTDYYNGKTISIDLDLIDEEIFEELIVEEESEEEE